MSVSLRSEVEGAEFGDARLSKRLVKIVDEFEGTPKLSIPAATTGRAEMEAAYRFCDNSKVTPDRILEPHRRATLERAQQCDTVLLVQDTTEVDLTRPNQQVAGTGPLTHDSRLGGYYHPLAAFDDQGLMLGNVWEKSWCREEIASGRTPVQKVQDNRARPIEQKESIRWVEGIRASVEFAQQCPDNRCVSIADSEADIYELFAEPRGETNPVHLIIRACENRRLMDSQSKLFDAVREGECLYKCSVDVSSRTQKTSSSKTNPRQRSRDARIAQVEVRATRVQLRPPARPDRELPPISVNVVMIEEPDPPAGQEPIRWVLVTTLPIDSLKQVKTIVSHYCVRWQIEIYFRTLKSGCRIQERYFEEITRLRNCIAMYSLVAWRIMYLCYLGRECPEVDCDVVFTDSEWKAVYKIIHHEEPPEHPPSLNEMIRMVATLGGYVDRVNTQPGTQTLWIGLQRLHDLSIAWEEFRPEFQPA